MSIEVQQAAIEQGKVPRLRQWILQCPFAAGAVEGQIVERGAAACDGVSCGGASESDGTGVGGEGAVVGPVAAAVDGAVAAGAGGRIEPPAALDGQVPGEGCDSAVGGQRRPVVDGQCVRLHVAVQRSRSGHRADNNRTEILAGGGIVRVGVRAHEVDRAAFEVGRAVVELYRTVVILLQVVAVIDAGLQVEGAFDIDRRLARPHPSRSVEGQVVIRAAGGEAGVGTRTDILDRAGVSIIPEVGERLRALQAQRAVVREERGRLQCQVVSIEVERGVGDVQVPEYAEIGRQALGASRIAAEGCIDDGPSAL